MYSGGKDSTFSLYKAYEEHSIECLITVEPRYNDSMLFHYPNVWVTKHQARVLGLPQVYEIQKDDETETLALALQKALQEYNIEGVVTGGIKSNYQKEKFQKVFNSLGLVAISPLWQIDEVKYLWSLLHSGFKVMLTKVSALGLNRDLLGKIIDENTLAYLIKASQRYKFNPSLEGGEGETLVLDMPLFKKELVIDDSSIFWFGDWGYLKVNSVSEKEKQRHV
ncbi:MAG: diphthine--ammonia ligase [Conexivisphaerales archaeon]